MTIFYLFGARRCALRVPRPALAVLALMAVAACDRSIVDPPGTLALDAELRQQLAFSGAVPLDAVAPQDPALVDLGRALFFDKILGGNRDVSCATCHDPLLDTGDGLSLSIGTGAVMQGSTRVLGAGRQLVPRNSPSLLNAALGVINERVTLFWDARVSEGSEPGQYLTPAGAALPAGLTSLLAAQAMFPMTNRTEMRGELGENDVYGAANELALYDDAQLAEIWSALMQRVLAIDDYVVMFEAAYPDIPTNLLGFQHAANAIASFEVQAFTYTNSPFDRYLAGQNDALSVDEKQGALLFFTETRCSSCHFGPLLGSGTFAATATPQLGPGVGSDAPLDRGVGAPFVGQTQSFIFRVPPLRNVELSGPYMHAGAYATLEAVVRHYNDVDKAVRTYDVTQLDPALQSTYHGDAATIDALLSALDSRLRQPFGFSEDELKQLVTFLKSLTDPAARDLSAVIPASVPSGLPVR